MTENTPRCRTCGNSLKALDGCTFCLEVKKVLVWPVISDAEHGLSASEVISVTLKALKRRLRRLTKELDKEGTEYNPTLTKDLATIGRTLKELAAEQRKLEDREEDRYDKLGIQGKMDLFIEQFFSMLPEDFQVKLLTDMKKVFDKQNTSLLED